jgi:hypothetical protein
LKTTTRHLVPFGLLIGACSSGIEVADFKPAQGPEGVHMEVKLNGDVIEGGKVVGELLAVRTDGVLLNVAGYQDNAKDDNRVVLVPYWMMNTARLEQMGRARIESQGEEMNEVYLNRLRLVSRFPQGLSDELLTELMSRQGQEKLEVPQRLE